MKYHYDKLILDHYKKLAINFKDSGDLSMQNTYIRESEVNFLRAFIQEIKKKKSCLKILDAGSGNGYTLDVLSTSFKDDQFFGYELSPELYEIASGRNLENVCFRLQDLREGEYLDRDFDIIYTERSMINILNRKHQIQVVDLLIDHLKPEGYLVFIESFVEGLNELNLARKEFALKEIEVPKHNLYLYEKDLNYHLSKYKLKEFDFKIKDNFLSTHFYMSRVFHEYIRPKGGKIKFSKFSEFFSNALPPSIGNFSPIKFKCFKKE